MRIGIDAREAFRPEPRGIGLYVRHLVREYAALAPSDEFLLYHQLPQPKPEPGRLRQFGRATLDLADAALGIVR
jgi:hypothetical protein